MSDYYQQSKQSLKNEIKESERVVAANELLKQFNWKFLHPYVQGFVIDHINTLNKKNELTEDVVNKIFIGDFYNLGYTLSFIDGYFNRSKNIEPFNYYIEQSLILCFQKDYMAAINIIIPSIEGILSNYLTEHKKRDISNNRYSQIKNSINYIIDDIIEKYQVALIKGTNNEKLTPKQIDYLVSLQRKYINNWYAIIDSFFRDSLFANTKEDTNNDHLKRHSIMHFLEKEKYYTLENYIRLFNALKFLTWIFLRLEGGSILNMIDDDTFIKKRLQYEAIIDKSKSLIKHKQVILIDYKKHNPEEYYKNIKYQKLENGLSFRGKIYLRIRRRLDEFFLNRTH